MSLTNSKLSVETIIPEGNITYYVTLQAANTGKSAVDYVSPLLTYNTGLGSFFVNNRVVPTSNVSSLGSIVTSPTPPPNPAVGDLWYDSSSDIQFEYVNDGVNRQWVDITGPTMSIGGPVSTNNFTYLPFTATANPTTTRNFGVGDSVGFSTFTSVSGGYTAYPYIYYIASGTLPTGLTLNSSTGVVSGTPSAVYSSSNVVFGVRDATNSAITTTVNFTVTGVIINYLVVSGGGGGGGGHPTGYGMGGGGGAGGMLCGSFIGSPGSYTITVGTGGAGGTGASQGTPGSFSAIVRGPTTIASGTGGGGGGLPTVDGPGIGGAGVGGTGSGGGGGGAVRPAGATGGAGGVALGSPGIGVAGTEGFPGGSGTSSPQPGPAIATGGGGGGGKGGAGTTGTNVPGAAGAGAGGAGAIWPFTGPGVFYAGGGGGGATTGTPQQSTAAAGGSGVGGSGSKQAGGSVAATPGTNGRGGGGGGGGQAGDTGGRGGSGVVILAIPTAAYPAVSAPGAAVSTPASAPGSTVLTYTAANPLSPSTFTFTI